MARLFISTGEVAGDLQGSLLIKALQQQAQAQGLDLEILALGGDRMAAAGATLLGHTSSIGSIGLLEALRYLWPSFRVQQQAKRYLQAHPPDLVVLIDYMAANIPLGRHLRRAFGIPIIYYIAPQEWVWSSSISTTAQIVQITDRLLAIFPEEARYYQRHGAQVRWVGHPLLDHLQAAPTRQTARQRLGIPDDQIAIALIPASRKQELKYLLPVIFAAAQQVQTQQPKARFWIPLSLEQYRQPIAEAIDAYGLRADIVTEPQLVLAAADLAITKSGTVNLEAALLGVPQVVIYRVSRLTAWIARHLLKFSIPFMSPPNLVVMRPIVPEFLQDEATPDQVAQAALDLLTPTRRQQVLSDYEHLRQALGETGAVERAAQEILALLPRP
jgi:lipid-A-disaccharide synthase